jgi:FrmR/RcnR family transcriptional regulator, repressor of frmRAB operon
MAREGPSIANAIGPIAAATAISNLRSRAAKDASPVSRPPIAIADGSSENGTTRILYRVYPYAIYCSMTHTIREKHKLLARVRRIRGQVEAIERALDREAGCEQVMHLIAGARGAMAGLMAEVVEEHVRTHLVDDKKYPGALKIEAAEQLLEVVRTYLK